MKHNIKLSFYSLFCLTLLGCNSDGGNENKKELPKEIVTNPILGVGPFPQWQPSKIESCKSGENISPVLERAWLHLKSDGDELKEPAIVFEDETFTVTKKVNTSDSAITYEPLSNGIFSSTYNHLSKQLFDDGTHGDLVAKDGIFTRDCVYLTQGVKNRSYNGFYNVRFINTQYRDSAPVKEVIEGVRVNDSGMFITLGEDYDTRYQGTWSLHNPEKCVACDKAWSIAGDVFDFFVMTTREEIGGQGYTRVHDNITGTGFTPPFEPNSHGYTIHDGKEHQEYLGVISMDSPEFIGLTHEFGHGLLGVGTVGFPEAGRAQWNAGDGMHIDSDTTLTGDLQGPFWDPARGWPYPVKLKLKNGDQTEVYLTQRSDGSFHLKPIDDERYVWSDIFLYMMGLKQADEVTETYHKLVNPILDNCRSTADNLVCTNTQVDAEKIISFTIDDFTAQHGVWGTEYPFDPKNIKLGVLNVSDRPHTEAEIVWFTNSFRDYTTNDGKARGEWINEVRWSYSTKGLSNIITDIEKMKVAK